MPFEDLPEGQTRFDPDAEKAMRKPKEELEEWEENAREEIKKLFGDFGKELGKTNINLINHLLSEQRKAVIEEIMEMVKDYYGEYMDINRGDLLARLKSKLK